jgi:pilus assembly protein CpaF
LAIHQYCHLICIIGGKGGVGKSVFAANLASAFLLELKAPSLLIDVDSRTAGDQSVILGLRPPKTMMDLNNFKGSLNQQVISQYIQKHASGLHYLAGVSGPEQTLSLNAEVLNKHMATISQAYRFIIADLGNDMGPEQLFSHRRLQCLADGHVSRSARSEPNQTSYAQAYDTDRAW